MRKKRANKYGAKAADGFGSKLERAVYQKLCDRQTLGLISDIKRQQTVVLLDGPPKTRIAWKIDFSFIEKDQLCYAEAKGVETADYRIKLKLFKFYRSERLEIWKGHWRRPVLTEVVNK